MNKPAIPATPTALIAEDKPLLAAALQAELARAWNFPDDMVSALDAAADPMAAQPFSRLGAVLHVQRS